MALRNKMKKIRYNITVILFYRYPYISLFRFGWRNNVMVDSAAGQDTTVDGYSLTLNAVKLTDLGEYTCQAYNNMVKGYTITGTSLYSAMDRL